MNDVKLYGIVTDIPDVHMIEGENGYKVAKFTLKVEQSIRDDGKDYSDEISLVAFRKTADLVEKYLQKDTAAFVSAHIHSGSYTTRNGDRITTQNIVVDRFEIAPSAGLSCPEAFQTMPETVDEYGLSENEY